MSARGPVRTDDLLQELSELSESLGGIVRGLPDKVPTELQVWTVYAGAEKVVAILKFRMRAERPGLFSELPGFKKSTDLLPVALEKMTEASKRIAENRLPEGLETLRRARENLRAYLSEESRVLMRERRRSSSGRPSS